MRNPSSLTIFLLISIGIIFLSTLYERRASLTNKVQSRKLELNSDIPSNLAQANPWLYEVQARIKRIQSVCGELCKIENLKSYKKYAKPISKKNEFIKSVKVNIDCDALFQSTDIDASDMTVPEVLPREIEHYFTLDGLFKVQEYRYFKNVYMGNEALSSKWTPEYIEAQIQEIKENKLRGTYGGNEVRKMNDILTKLDLKKKRIMVIGSENSWIESLLLMHGVDHVVTLEFGDIVSTHPKIQTITPLQFRRMYREKEIGKFDGVIAFSTIEHSGLGRYGDALNPWGDLLASARSWCVTKRKGFFLLGLPSGTDKIVYNAHRMYGNYRWPLVTANWLPATDVNEIHESFYTERGKIVTRSFYKP